ncbi:MAG: M4 family metallopeptidase [Ignavibacteria bacterium]|nr:M4 family metallopeptidase [Ignavibacteria bacterium]
MHTLILSRISRVAQRVAYRSGILLALLAVLPLASAFAQGNGKTAFKQHVIERHRDFTGAVSAEKIAAVGRTFQRWEQSNAVLERRRELRAQPGLTIDQILAYDELASRVTGFHVVWDETHTVPIYIAGLPLCTGGQNAASSDEAATLQRFFALYGPLLRIADGTREFRVTERIVSEDGSSHLRLAQYRDDIPVWESQIVLQADARGNVRLFMGRYIPTPASDINAFPATGDREALALFAKSIGRPLPPSGASSDPLFEAPAPFAGRVWYAPSPRVPARAAYAVEMHPSLTERWRGVVDAASGAVLRSYNAVCSDGPEKASAKDLNNVTRSIDTYLSGGRYYMIDASRPMFDPARSTMPRDPAGGIVTLDARNTDLSSVVYVTSADNTWTIPATVSAHYNAAVTYEYFRATHGRSGIDGNGATILSIVNATESGQAMENAYWNGRFMVYGNGGSLFKPFAGSLDVGAHEMTHGVTEHSAGLLYLNQSGALNEAFSDIFGAMVDRDDWKLGEDIVIGTATFPTGAMRDLSDPHNGTSAGSPAWQPNHMREFQALPESQDNGGVHINSGIPNHAAYLLSTAITREKAERILYRALTTKLTTQSQFIDFRLALVRSAEELYGAGGAEVAACKSACDQVGITDGNGTKDPPDLPPVNAADRLLFVSTDVTDPFFLWTVNPPAGPSDFAALSKTVIFGRPSVSDDGSIAVFIDGAGALRSIALNPSAPNEQVLDTSAVWGSVALSRDKRLIALTTFAAEPAIYLFDLGGPVVLGKQFEIYAPTYSGGKMSDVAQFADAMDFSADGERLLFDTYNEVDIAGEKIGYWEINLLEAWDKGGNTFGSGAIYRIFPQETGYDLGNPSFARTKQTVFAFDVSDSYSLSGYVLASDLLKDGASLIAELPYNSPGYPNYRGDDRVISFAATPLHGGNGVDSVYNVPLAADALTPAGPPAGFIPSAMFPIWYRNGVRPTGIAQPSTVPASLQLAQNYPNPFGAGAASTTIAYALPDTRDVLLTVHDAMGRTVKVLARGHGNAGTHAAVWNGTDERGRSCPAGVYLCRLVAGSHTATRTMLLVK